MYMFNYAAIDHMRKVRSSHFQKCLSDDTVKIRLHSAGGNTVPLSVIPRDTVLQLFYPSLLNRPGSFDMYYYGFGVIEYPGKDNAPPQFAFNAKYDPNGSRFAFFGGIPKNQAEDTPFITFGVLRTETVYVDPDTAKDPEHVMGVIYNEQYQVISGPPIVITDQVNDYAWQQYREYLNAELESLYSSEKARGVLRTGDHLPPV